MLKESNINFNLLYMRLLRCELPFSINHQNTCIYDCCSPIRGRAEFPNSRIPFLILIQAIVAVGIAAIGSTLKLLWNRSKSQTWQSWNLAQILTPKVDVSKDQDVKTRVNLLHFLVVDVKARCRHLVNHRQHLDIRVLLWITIGQLIWTFRSSYFVCLWRGRSGVLL